MKIDDKLIKHLAMLGRLEFGEAETEAIKVDLEKMTGFIEKLNELDTSGILPLRHMQFFTNADTFAGALREDDVKPAITPDEALREAAEKAPPYFVVPKVIHH